MEVTRSERGAILKMMAYIEDERSRLWEDYKGLLDRLRVLDEIDRPSIQAESKLFTPDPGLMLFNSAAPKQEAIPVKEEPSFEPNETAATLEVPQYSPIDELMKQDEYLTQQEEYILEDAPSGAVHDAPTLGDLFAQQEEVKDTPKFIKEIEELKDMDAKNNPLKTPSTRDVKIVAQFVKAILKEAGVPMKTAELIKKLKYANVDTTSPYVLLSQVRNYEPKIENIAHGFYQYKW